MPEQPIASRNILKLNNLLLQVLLAYLGSEVLDNALVDSLFRDRVLFLLLLNVLLFVIFKIYDDIRDLFPLAVLRDQVQEKAPSLGLMSLSKFHLVCVPEV
jgi:hypothetical protein